MLMKFGWLDDQSSQCHQRADRGQVGHLHQFGEFGRGACRDNTAAGVNERLLGFPDQLRRRANLDRYVPL